MKRTVFCLLAFLSPCWGQNVSDLVGPNRGWIMSDNPNYNPLYQWALRMESLASTGPTVGTGNTFYADSGVATAGDGTTWGKAKSTLAGAIALCTANNGDIIYVAQGHNESLTAADAVDLNVAGIIVIGCGQGSDRPRFDFDHADGEFVIGAAAVTVRNLTFMASVTAVTHCIDVENAGDWAVIEDCEFLEGEAAGTDEFIDCIQVGTTATNVTIRYNTYTNIGGVGANNFIDLSAATIGNPRIYGNVIKGEFAEAGIWGGAAIPTDVVCIGNVVENRTTGQFGIEFAGAATGVYGDNWVYTDAFATSIDPGSMKCVAPCWVAITIDAAPLMFPVQTGSITAVTIAADSIGASEIASAAIAADEIATDAIGSAEIATDAIGAAEIAASAIGADELAADAVGASELANSAVNEIEDGVQAAIDANGVIQGLALNAAPVANSLAAFIASGGTGLGTQLATSKSLVDAIGTNGTTIADTATGVAGIIGVPTDADNVVDSSTIVSNGDGSVLERQEYTQKIQEIQMATGLHVVQGTGMSLAVWYVNGGVTSGTGKSPTTAFGTLGEALAVCSNTVDDWILVMDYSGGGATISLTDAFCHIIGMGNGKTMPYPRFMPASAVAAFEFKNASDRVELANLVIGGGDATVPAITADAEASAGAYACYIHDCVIGRDASAAPANDGILIASGADMPYLIIENCTFYGAWAGLVGCDQSGIEIAGNCTGGSILNCFFQGIGSSTNPAINLSGTVGGMRIQGNRIAGTDDASAGWGITLSANCTDIFVDDNRAASSDAAGDTSAFVDSAADEANAWGANYTDITLDLP